MLKATIKYIRGMLGTWPPFPRGRSDEGRHEAKVPRGSGNPLKILYLHNGEDWAIHSVGQLWLADLEGVEVTFLEVTWKGMLKNGAAPAFDGYDFVWFGYLQLYLAHMYDVKRSIVAVHDPVELFQQQADWKSLNMLPGSKAGLQTLEYIVTASVELQEALKRNGFDAHRIPTMTRLVLRDEGDMMTTKCDALSVFHPYPRKDPELMDSVREACEASLDMRFELKVGRKTFLAEQQYVELLDRHEVYVCTSFQEGGPLPAMDAMCRGAVVLTTPVGQLRELIRDGENGFFCRTTDEFVEKMRLLSTDHDRLQQMRLASRRTIEEIRNSGLIQQRCSAFCVDHLAPNKLDLDGIGSETDR